MRQSKPDRKRQTDGKEIACCIRHGFVRRKTCLTVVYDSIRCIVCVRIVIICRREKKMTDREANCGKEDTTDLMNNTG